MEIFTLGHSSHAIERLVELLRLHGMETVADVRTHPHSRFAPQFNSGPLRAALARSGLGYVHLPALGGRPDDPALLQPDGTPDYDRIQASAAFLGGIEELLALAQTRRVVLLCAEGDPMECHRERLIAPVLRARGVTVRHILPDGTLAAPPAQGALEF
jgi:uncharacterized protein (DUF488 family)